MPRTCLRMAAIALLPMAVLVIGACNLPAPSTPTAATPISILPAASPGAGTAVLGGRVWNDACSPGPAGTIPPGCIVIDAMGNVQADGVMDPGETGIAGVPVLLGAGACPSSGLATTYTTGDGAYQFAGLAAGTYCISVAPPPALPGAPLPGGVWTYPTLVDPFGVAFATVTLADGELRVHLNFGWDYQEAGAPTPTEPPASPTPSDTPTPTLTPTATPSSGDPRARLGEPTWRDPFDSGANWPLYTDEHVRFTVEDGKLVMVAFKAELWDGWVLTWPEIERFYLEAPITFGACAERDRAGLVFRARAVTPGNYVGYLFAVTCDGRYSLRAWNAPGFSGIVDWTPDARIQAGPNATNRLGVWVEGDRIQLYVNGELLREVTDSSHTGRMFGLFVGAAKTAGFTARVDEIAYWRLP